MREDLRAALKAMAVGQGTAVSAAEFQRIEDARERKNFEAIQKKIINEWQLVQAELDATVDIVEYRRRMARWRQRLEQARDRFERFLRLRQRQQDDARVRTLTMLLNLIVMLLTVASQQQRHREEQGDGAGAPPPPSSIPRPQC